MAGPEDFEGFEWGRNQNPVLVASRTLLLIYAAKLFDGDFIEWEDRRRAWGEPRVVCVGEVEGRILTVVWTPRSTLRRIISARPASRSEREQLYEHRQAQQQRDS